MPSLPPATLSEAEAAERLGVGLKWLADQGRAGRVPFVQMGRYRRFTEAHIDDIIAARTVTPGQSLGRSARSRKRKAS